MEEDILDDYIEDKEPKPVFKTRAVIIWSVFVIIAILFKIQNWKGYLIILLFSSAGLQAYCTNGYIRKDERNDLNTGLSFLGLVWFVLMILGAISPSGFYLNINAVIIYLIVFIIYFLIYYLIFYLKKKKVNKH